MGAKFVSKSAVGYNASSPADDGSTAASNQITWAKHKTKLGDPIKTLAEDINTALVTAFDYSVRQITSSDNTVANDHMRCVEIASTVTTAITVSLGDAATMTNNYRVFIKNSSAISQTIGRVTVGDTIDGSAANLSLPPGGGVVLQTNAAANGYLTVARTMAHLEGTWTAAFVCGTSGTVTLSAATGSYVKIGNAVYISGMFTVDSVSSPNGTISITGLPFTSANNDRNASAISVRCSGLTAGVAAVQAYVPKGASAITVENFAAGGPGANTAGNMQAGSTVTVGGFYSVG